jgi:hypothetical protein
MNSVAKMVQQMLAAGMSHDAIVMAVDGACSSMMDAIEVQTSKRRAKAAERQQRKRERDLFAEDNTKASVAVTPETENESRESRDMTPERSESKKEVPTPLRKTTFSELNSSEKAADAAQNGAVIEFPNVHSPPVYTDARHELWGEGTAILIQLGMKNDAARRNIGRWLRDSGNDAVTVLGAIQRARDHRVHDPVPWITRAIETTGAPNGTNRYAHRQSGRGVSRSLIEAADRAIEAADRAAGEADGRGPLRENVAGLLPDRRSG